MDITATLKCNNNCVFCPRQDYLRLIACQSTKEIYRDIEKARQASDNIVFSGGEVTTLKEIWKIIDFARKLNFKKIGIITNGRKLQDFDFASRLGAFGVNDVAISIYSIDDKVHDGVTRRKGSCQETKNGIINMLKLSKKYGISLRINLVLNFWNYHDILSTLSRLSSMGINNLTVAEQIIIHKESKYLSFQKIKKFLRRVKQLRLKGVRLCLRGFCASFFNDKFYDSNGLIIKKSNPLIILETHEVDTLVKKSSSKNEYLKKFKMLFRRIEKCKDCFLNSSCPGIQKAYF